MVQKSDIHVKIVDELLKKLGVKCDLDSASREQIYKKMFKLYHPNKKNLKLNLHGLKWLKRFFKSYEIKLSSEIITSKQFRNLQENIVFPYFINNQKIVLFSSLDALELILLDGDLKNYRPN